MSAGAQERRVVVLSGAGASKAVNPSKYPTTIEFFEGLPDEVRSDRYFNFVLNFLRESGADPIDIELVLWELQKLLEFYEAVTSNNTIVGRAINQPNGGAQPEL